MKTMNYSLLRAIFALVMGLVLVLWPDAAGDYIVITVGILFMVPGLISLVGYFALKPRQEVSPRFPIEGVGSLLFGLWLVIMPGFFADVLMFVLGFILMMGGLQQLASLMVARKWTRVPVGFYVVPVLLLVAGVVSLFNPTDARNTVFIILGVSGMVYALSELIHWFKFTRHRPQPVKKNAEVEDAVIIEE